MPIETDERSRPADAPPRPIHIARNRRLSATITVADPDEALVVIEVEAGNLPTSARYDLVEAVFAHPAVKTRRRIRATVPLGDSELLAGFVRHCPDVRTRAAGVSCLVDARR